MHPLLSVITTEAVIFFRTFVKYRIIRYTAIHFASMNIRHTLIYALFAIGIVACSDSNDIDKPAPRPDGKMPISIAPSIADADDFGKEQFRTGDLVGLYAVNYNGSSSGGWSTTGNQVDNVAYEYNASSKLWVAKGNALYRDDNTAVDIACYYPHTTITQISANHFSVAIDQTSAYESSDILWGKQRAVKPSTEAVAIELKPIMAHLELRLVEGSGWSAGEWSKLSKSVTLCGVKSDIYLNIATGTTTATTTEPTNIVAHRDGDSFRAVVAPQEIKLSTRLFEANIDGELYYLTIPEKVVLKSGECRSFELVVSKRAPAGQSSKLSGNIIGTRYSVDYNTGQQSESVNTKSNLFDQNYDTYFASYDRSNTWVGLDLGEPHVITKVGYSPRITQPTRVVTALIEGANNADFSDALPIYIIKESAEERVMTYADVTCSRGFRYVRYVTPNDKRCNLAELEFYGYKSAGDDSQLYQLTNLPTVVINTANAQDITSKEVEIMSTVYIISNNGTSLLTDTQTGVRGRGNASWNFEKKPYRLKFSKKRSPLDAPAEAKKWTLLSNHGDKTLMRNILAFEVSRRLGMAYTPYCCPVDVILNGEYKGCYQLCDQVDVREHRVDVTEMNTSDNTGVNLTGGYLIEIDAYASTTEKVYFYSRRGTPVTIKSPDDDKITAEQRSYIENHFNKMEDAVFASNYTDPTNGYRKYLDLDSYLRHFIIGEFVGNTDTYWSVYMYKQRGDDLFYVGPVWDCDLAFENDYRTYPINDTDDYLYCGKSSGASDAVNQMNNRIIKNDPLAHAELVALWEEAKRNGINVDSLLEYVNDTAALLDESQELNFKRWPILNQWVHMNFQALGSYEAEVGTVRTYIEERVDKLDYLIYK